MRTPRAAIAVLALSIAGCAGNAFELEPGQCLDEPSSAEVADVELVHCAEPHDLEIYRIAELTERSVDAVAIDADSFDLCLESFDGFVGRPYADSELDIYYLMPSEGSWASGDRQLVCAVYDLGGAQITGTAENIRR